MSSWNFLASLLLGLARLKFRQSSPINLVLSTYLLGFIFELEVGVVLVVDFLLFSDDLFWILVFARSAHALVVGAGAGMNLLGCDFALMLLFLVEVFLF